MYNLKKNENKVSTLSITMNLVMGDNKSCIFKNVRNEESNSERITWISTTGKESFELELTREQFLELEKLINKFKTAILGNVGKEKIRKSRGGIEETDEEFDIGTFF